MIDDIQDFRVFFFIIVMILGYMGAGWKEEFPMVVLRLGLFQIHM